MHVVARPALAAPGHRVADRHGATFDVRHRGGPVAATHALDFFGPVGWILTQTLASMQRRPLKLHICSSLYSPHGYLLEAEALTHGGADALDASAALHLQIDAGQTTAEVEAPPRPHQRQQRYHDDQLHPLLAAAPDTCHQRGQGGERK